MEQRVSYRTVMVEGISIFYREAGPKGAPTILLLHGLPSSSRMFQPLLARLADHYHLVAPDYPGFGHSDWPDPKQFSYTFDHIAHVMNGFTQRNFSLIATAKRSPVLWTNEYFRSSESICRFGDAPSPCSIWINGCRNTAGNHENSTRRKSIEQFRERISFAIGPKWRSSAKKNCPVRDVRMLRAASRACWSE